MSVRPARYPPHSRQPRSPAPGSGRTDATVRTDATGRTDPVFVDRTGRRRRLGAVVASAAGLALILVALAMFVGFTGVGGGRLPGLPGAVDPAATVVPAPDHAVAPGPPEHTPPPSVTRDPTPSADTGEPSRSSNGHRPTQTPSHGKKK